MTVDRQSPPAAHSRRTMLGLAAAGGAAVVALALHSRRAAASTMPKTAVAYQDKPKGAARCDNCSQWQAPASCKVVSGTISPSGWCSIYHAIPKA
jgi:hypothetical protein